jgi:hypothetical protein
MADIIPFPKPRADDAAAALRGGISRLTGLSATLGGFRDSLSDKHATLGALKERLLAQAFQSHAIGTLALAVEAAIAADDGAAMAALQDQIEQRMRHADAGRDSGCRQVDAAD